MTRFLALLIVVPSLAYGSSEKMKISFAPSEDGGGYVYEIDMSLVPNLPMWDVEAGNPPLDIKAAHSVATRTLKDLKLSSKMKLGYIRLSSASVVGKYEVWYYAITFVNDAMRINDGFVEKTVYVLMNGDVVKPKKISKEEYENWFK